MIRKSMIPSEEDQIEFLTTILGDLTYGAFEGAPQGSLQLPEGPMFHMRIGLLLTFPTQAIMAWGHFIKTRRVEQDFPVEDFDMGPLDPKDPAKSLYGTGRVKRWQPMMTKKADEAYQSAVEQKRIYEQKRAIQAQMEAEHHRHTAELEKTKAMSVPLHVSRETAISLILQAIAAGASPEQIMTLKRRFML